MRTLIAFLLLVTAVHGEDRVKKLLQEKAATLDLLVKINTQRYRAGEAPISDVLSAQQMLLNVLLELAEDKATRISILKEWIGIVKEIQKTAVARDESRQGSRADVLAARAAYLEVTIRLARENVVKVGWGHLKGRFVFDGDPPKPKRLVVNKDKDYFGKFNIVDESLVVGKDKGIANVLIYLRRTPAKVHESYAKTAKREVSLQAVKGRFAPHILLMRTSQTLLLKNSENINVSVRYLSAYQSFVHTLRPNVNYSKKLRFSEIAPAPIVNFIHPWFLAYGMVVDHPYAAVSSKTGTFEIRNLPSGELPFQIWHERCKALSVKPADGRGRLKVTIKTDEITDLGTITIPASALKK